MKNNSWSRYLYLPRYLPLILLVLTCLLISAYLGFLTPKAISNLYQSYTNQEQFDSAFHFLIILFAAEYLNRIIYQISVTKYVQKLVEYVRSLCYGNWLNSYEVIETGKNNKDRYPLGEVLARIISDTESVRELVSMGGFGIFIDIFFITSCLISFISLNTTSGIFLIIAEVSACAFLLWGSRYIARVFLQVRVATGMLSRTLADIIGGVRQIFYTPSFNYSKIKAEKSFDDFLSKQLKANVWDASYYSVAESLFPILIALLVIIFPYSHITEVAILAAIIELIQRSIGPIKEITSKISSIQRARTGIIRMNEFNSDLTKGPSSSGERHHTKMNFQKYKVNIDLFEYDIGGKDNQKFHLEDINFEATRGHLVGIVGLSGSGKSTLLKILSTQILTPNCHINLIGDSGERLDYNGKASELAQYKEFISLVSQDSHIFSDNLKFNITMGEESGFDSFWDLMIDYLPYLKTWGVNPDTQVKLSEISMGQKQLISALRSCFLSKTIVLFDEISSGMDSELEEALRKMVLFTQKNSLTIIVAHRIETIMGADKIIVLDQGKKMAEGTHKELLSESELYKELIEKLRSLS